jgi:hypothetical protein
VPYRCWIHAPQGKTLARFVPVSRNGSTSWGPIFFGTVYLTQLDGRRQATLAIGNQRFFADELEPFVP